LETDIFDLLILVIDSYGAFFTGLIERGRTGVASITPFPLLTAIGLDVEVGREPGDFFGRSTRRHKEAVISPKDF
jgi:hypothetical protein